MGVIHAISDYPRGSRRSPKMRIISSKGEFLLKRRAPGRDDPERVAFAQDLQLNLAERGFPVAALIGRRDNGRRLVTLRERTYELFAFIRGRRDDRTEGAAEEAGRTMGLMHRLLLHFQPTYTPPFNSYHASATVDAAVQQVPAAVDAVEPNVNVAEFTKQCRTLLRVYMDAAERTEAAGFRTWPVQVIHGDWHPGNLLYRDGRIVAVLDFDSSRVEPRMIDVANAALQCSMTTSDPDHPERWPDHLDVGRIRALLRGYDATSGMPLEPEERDALPWLILEAMILESVLPIAASGRFGPLRGSAFLEMVDRKARWLRPRANRLLECDEDA